MKCLIYYISNKSYTLQLTQLYFQQIIYTTTRTIIFPTNHIHYDSHNYISNKSYTLRLTIIFPTNHTLRLTKLYFYLVEKPGFGCGMKSRFHFILPLIRKWTVFWWLITRDDYLWMSKNTYFYSLLHTVKYIYEQTWWS